ncbi:PepSY domain-containing protein [Streptomyces sp. NPDC003077]|uniref:PepSY domain-containing protein n=1 Tax=Streptomyces sp. NPDC003077 TaxID=3154443 RepID=UPI0033AB6DDC
MGVRRAERGAGAPEAGPAPGRRPGVPRAVAVVCAVAAAGALAAGCGDDNGDGGGGNASASGTASASGSTSPSPSGSGSGTASPSGSGSPSERLTEDQAERKRLVPQAKVPYDKAIVTALGAVSGARLVHLELKQHSGATPQWETEVARDDGTASELSVDAVSGKASNPQSKHQDDEDKRKLADRLREADVTPQQATDTATGRKKGTVTDVELERDDNDRLIWSVDVVTTDDWNKTTYDIDATNRKVLREHVDRD